MTEERSIPILPARDLVATRALYERLGFQVGYWSPTEYGIFGRGDLVVHYFAHPVLDPAENYAGCYWRVPDADAFFTEFAALGLPTHGLPRVVPPATTPWGMREFVLHDPSNNLVRIGHELETAAVPAGDVQVLALAGSLRAKSSNAALLRAAAKLAPEGVGVRVFGGLASLPAFDPDLAAAGREPLSVLHFRAAVAAAHALFVCTPEYAYGVPGALKNALDWLVSSGVANDKPVLLLSASPSFTGGQHALDAFRLIFSAFTAILPDERAIAVAAPRQKLGPDETIADPALRDAVARAFATLARDARTRRS